MSFVHFLKLNCLLLHLLSFKISLCILESSLSLHMGFTCIFSQYVHACQTTSVMYESVPHCGLWPTRFLCPWDSPGKDAGVGCCFLLQGIFPTQGSNLCLTLPAPAGRFFTTSTPWKTPSVCSFCLYSFNRAFQRVRIFNFMKSNLPNSLFIHHVFAVKSKYSLPSSQRFYSIFFKFCTLHLNPWSTSS